MPSTELTATQALPETSPHRYQGLSTSYSAWCLCDSLAWLQAPKGSGPSVWVFGESASCPALVLDHCEQLNHCMFTTEVIWRSLRAARACLDAARSDLATHH